MKRGTAAHVLVLLNYVQSTLLFSAHHSGAAAPFWLLFLCGEHDIHTNTKEEAAAGLLEMLEATIVGPGLFLKDTTFLLSDTPTLADFRLAPTVYPPLCARGGRTRESNSQLTALALNKPSSFLAPE